MTGARRNLGWLACAALVLAAPAAAAAGGARATRTDLDVERRRVAALESEVALASTRKPYLVLDLGSRTLRYRLMGMTTREVALPGLTIKGLAAATTGAPPPTLAGIFTLREKDGDPRLKPLSPEQVEAGADDENVANVLPPEPPKAYGLKFKQPIAVRVEGRPQAAGVHGVWASLIGGWRRLFGTQDDGEAQLVVSLTLDAGTAAELYRSLLPDEHWLVLPPSGYVLPAAGQEAPPRPKSPRPIPTVPAKPVKPIEPPGVPFQIPPPVDDNGGHENETQPGPPPDGGGTSAPPSSGTPSASPVKENAA
jgi:hypothetical protein